MKRAILLAALLIDAVGGQGQRRAVGSPHVFVLGQGAPASTTTGVIEEVLATVPIQAGTVSTNGATIEVMIFAHGTAAGGNATVRVRVGGIGGVIAADSGNQAITNVNLGIMEIDIQKRSDTTATTQSKFNTLSDKGIGTGSPGFFSNRINVNWANAQDLVITATSSITGNLVLDSHQVVLYQ